MFRSAGLAPGNGSGDYLQSYPLSSNHLVLDQTTLSMQPQGAAPPTALHLFDDFLLRGYTTQGFDVSGELVFVGHGIVSEAHGIDEYKGTDVTGRIVVVLDGRPKDRNDLRGDSQGRAKRTAARDRGAIGLVVLADLDQPASREALDNLADQLHNPTLSIPTAEADTAFPVITLKGDAAEALMTAGGLKLADERAAHEQIPLPGKSMRGLRLALHAPVVTEASHAYNIAGIVRGSDPVPEGRVRDRLRAQRPPRHPEGRPREQRRRRQRQWHHHAAHHGRGAGERPPLKRSVLFLSVSGEEKGLWGSDWWCEHPTVPLDHCVADINIDMVGRNDPDAVGATPSPDRPEYNTIVARAVELGPQAGLKVTWTAPAASDDRVDNYYQRSDHYNFDRKGIPVVFFFSGLHEDYHRPTDTLEKINRDKLERMVRLVTLLAADVADTPARPARIKAAGG